MSDFFQDGPKLTNSFLANRWLAAYLRFKLPRAMREDVESDLDRFGENCVGEYLQLARRAEREKPTLVQFDPWGRRVDEIRMSTAWQELQNISAREGLISIGYRRTQGEFSRLYQFAKLYLFHPSSAFFTCPLAMTDGAAKVLENYSSLPVHREAFSHLTTNKPDQFWTSGQWMTEKTGGSDVSGTSTQVQYDSEGRALLYGTKWFSSATTSQMALALARTPEAPDGSRGLTLFLVRLNVQPGVLNPLKILRLKDKLGTWALPTAELSLVGAVATQVGETHQGIKTVATMLNITRLYNCVCSIGQMTRALDSMKDYSSRRRVFNQTLDNHVLHTTTMAGEEIKALAGFVLTFELVHLLGREECGTGSAAEADILRLMTPICKLFTARSAVQVASEVVEGFGGAGYSEDSGIPVHLRDAQVFAIWEGSTNVLSLDMIRALQKTNGMAALKADVRTKLSSVCCDSLAGHVQFLIVATIELEANLKLWQGLSVTAQQASARNLAFYLGRYYSYVLLLVWANAESDFNRQVLTAWLEQFQSEFLGRWQPTSDADCLRTRRMWLDKLKI